MAERKNTVSLTINVCLTDFPYMEKSLRHIFRALNYPFSERLIALDRSDPEGTFQKRKHGAFEDCAAALEQMRNEGLVDRIDIVPWDAKSKNRIGQKYFHTQTFASRCDHGTAVYQYLFALEQCTSDYILHVDSDILFSHHRGESWIEEGIQLMQQKSDVAFVVPGHPPQAESLSEFLFGKRRNPNNDRWTFTTNVSTRYFLVDRLRFETKLLPLVREHPEERLEQSLTFTSKSRGFCRATFNTSNTWVIHPKPHNRNYVKYLDTLIWTVENNLYPFRRFGRYPWDLNTNHRYIWPWLITAGYSRWKGIRKTDQAS